MTGRLKRILSDGELNAACWELQDEYDNKFPASIYDEYVRGKADHGRVFPVGGYESWEHRWLMGTGVRPKGW